MVVVEDILGLNAVTPSSFPQKVTKSERSKQRSVREALSHISVNLRPPEQYSRAASWCCCRASFKTYRNAGVWVYFLTYSFHFSELCTPFKSGSYRIPISLLTFALASSCMNVMECCPGNRTCSSVCCVLFLRIKRK